MKCVNEIFYIHNYCPMIIIDGNTNVIMGYDIWRQHLLISACDNILWRGVQNCMKLLFTGGPVIYIMVAIMHCPTNESIINNQCPTTSEPTQTPLIGCPWAKPPKIYPYRTGKPRESIGKPLPKPRKLE